MPTIPCRTIREVDRRRCQGSIQCPSDLMPVDMLVNSNEIIGSLRMVLIHDDGAKEEIFGESPRIEGDVHKRIEWRLRR